MKKLTIIILLAASFTATAQTYKIPIPNTNLNWVFQNLDDNPKIATLVKDTLYIHKLIEPFKSIKEQSNELRYLKWHGKVYRYQYAFIDQAYLFGNLKGKAIY
jgi:hypothetical protein